MRSEIVMDGLFKVTDAGQVFRFKKDEWIPATISNTSRDGKYQAVSYMKEGKQKFVYVHRLVATAFLPNSGNLPQVNHKDGNPQNNHVGNLEWCTPSQNVRHAYATGLALSVRNAEPCLGCGEPTNAKDKICTVCKRELRKEVKADNHLADIRDTLGGIDLELLNPVEREYIKYRMNGLTLSEIAGMYGVSRQYVDAVIKKAIIRSGMPTKQSAAARKSILQLRVQLEKKRSKLEVLSLKTHELEDEITEIGTTIRMLESGRRDTTG